MPDPGGWEWVDEARPGQNRHKWGCASAQTRDVTTVATSGQAPALRVLLLSDTKVCCPSRERPTIIS